MVCAVLWCRGDGGRACRLLLPGQVECRLWEQGIPLVEPSPQPLPNHQRAWLAQELITEMIKHNPNYKPPSDYRPEKKYTKLPIPITEYPVRAREGAGGGDSVGSCVEVVVVEVRQGCRVLLYTTHACRCSARSNTTSSA